MGAHIILGSNGVPTLWALEIKLDTAACTNEIVRAMGRKAFRAKQLFAIGTFIVLDLQWLAAVRTFTHMIWS